MEDKGVTRKMNILQKDKLKKFFKNIWKVIVFISIWQFMVFCIISITMLLTLGLVYMESMGIDISEISIGIIWMLRVGLGCTAIIMIDLFYRMFIKKEIGE